LTLPFSGEAALDLPPAEPEPPARVVANSAWSLLAQGVDALIGGAVAIYAVRTFTPSSWGHYSTAIALVALFTVISGAGLAPRALREMTSAAPRQGEILGVTFRALAWTSCLAATALLVVVPLLGYPREVLLLVLVLAPFLLLDPGLATLAAAFNARSQLVFAAHAQLARSAVYGALALAVVATARGVLGLALATLIAALCSAVIALVLLRARLGLRVRLSQPRGEVLTFLRAAVPIGGIGLVGVVYDRVDTLMLSLLSSAARVAHYAVPYGFVRLSWLVPSVVSAAFFPLLNRRVDSGSSDAGELFFLVVRVFLLLGLPISLLLAVGSPTLIPLAFGGPPDHGLDLRLRLPELHPVVRDARVPTGARGPWRPGRWACGERGGELRSDPALRPERGGCGARGFRPSGGRRAGRLHPP
jgi:O-antigen/teichoic acid export membrane protein